MNVDITKLKLCLGIMSARRSTENLRADELATLGWNKPYHPVRNEAMELAEDYFNEVMVSLAELANATSLEVVNLGEMTQATANDIMALSGSMSLLQTKVDSGLPLA